MWLGRQAGDGAGLPPARGVSLKSFEQDDSARCPSGHRVKDGAEGHYQREENGEKAGMKRCRDDPATHLGCRLLRSLAVQGAEG